MRLFQDLRYKLLALGVAVLLWVVASGTTDEERSFDVPLSFQNVPAEIVIVDKGVDEVNVRVRGGRAALRNVSPRTMEYRIDVSGAKPGAADFDIEEFQLASQLPRGAQIVSRSPSRLEVKFERRGTKVVRVRADLDGEVPEGFALAAVEVDPDRVRISGARSEVLRLSEVITEPLLLAGQTESFERELRLSVGARNAWVEEPNSVKVRVRIEPSAATAPAPQGKG